METLELEPLNGNLIHFGRAQQFCIVSHSLVTDEEIGEGR